MHDQCMNCVTCGKPAIVACIDAADVRITTSLTQAFMETAPSAFGVCGECFGQDNPVIDPGDVLIFVGMTH